MILNSDGSGRFIFDLVSLHVISVIPELLIPRQYLLRLSARDNNNSSERLIFDLSGADPFKLAGRESHSIRHDQ